MGRKKISYIDSILLRKRSFYTPANIIAGLKSPVTYINLRKEYVNLRKIALRRLKTLETTEYRDLESLKGYFKYPFEILRNLKDNRRFAYEFMRVVHFLDSDYTITSLKELRAQDLQSIDTLHQHGYKFVTRKNYRQFATFMDLVNSRITANMRYVTETIMSLFEESINDKTGKVNEQKLRRAFNAYIDEENKRIKKANDALSKLSPEEIKALQQNVGVIFGNRGK